MKCLSLTAALVTSLSFPAFAQAPAPAPAPAPAKPDTPAAQPPPAVKDGAPVPAAGPAPAPARPKDVAMPFDPTRAGSPARKSKNEAAVKKEVEAWWVAEETLVKSKSFQAIADRVDFPLMLVTDSMTGVPTGTVTNREQYIAMMKPMWEATPPELKVAHRFTTTVLSDSIVVVVDDYTATLNKQPVKGRSSAMLVKVDGQWKTKVMAEAGWGDAPGVTATPAAAAPAPGAADAGRPDAGAPDAGRPDAGAPAKK